MSKERRMVSVLHKCETLEDTKDGRVGGLAVGKTFRFPSGDTYTVQPDGSVVNANQKNYTNKADKKALKRWRREQRLAQKSQT